MSAHAAAVEAMAAGVAAAFGPDDSPEDAARLALAALVRSVAVRAALVGAMHRCAPPGAPGRCFRPCGYLGEAGEYADAILAALRPDDEGDTDV